MLLTLSDTDGSRVSIHGPPGTLEFVASMRYFVRRANLELCVSPPGTAYQDDNILVTPWPLVVGGTEGAPSAEAARAAVVSVHGTATPAQDGSVSIKLGRPRGNAAGVKRPKCTGGDAPDVRPAFSCNTCTSPYLTRMSTAWSA